MYSLKPVDNKNNLQQNQNDFPMTSRWEPYVEKTGPMTSRWDAWAP